MRPLMALVLVLASFGCGGKGASAENATGAAPQKGKLVFTVRTAKDLNELQLEYIRRINSGFDGELVVQIEGPIPTKGWVLHPGRDAQDRSPTIDITLRGSEGAILDAPGELFARRLVMERVQLRVSNLNARWTVGQSAHLSDVVVADARGASMDGSGTLISLKAWGPKAGSPNPVEAHLARCWFLRNFADTKAMVLLAFDLTEGRRAIWDKVHFTEGGFLGNVLATDLQITGAREVLVRDSLWFRDRADGVLIRLVSSGITTVSGSRLVVADRAQIAAHGAETPDVVVTDTTKIITAKALAGSTPGYTASAAVHLTERQWPQHTELAALVGAFEQPVDCAALAAARARLLATSQPR